MFMNREFCYECTYISYLIIFFVLYFLGYFCIPLSRFYTFPTFYPDGRSRGALSTKVNTVALSVNPQPRGDRLDTDSLMSLFIVRG